MRLTTIVKQQKEKSKHTKMIQKLGRLQSVVSVDLGTRRDCSLNAFSWDFDNTRMNLHKTHIIWNITSPLSHVHERGVTEGFL